MKIQCKNPANMASKSVYLACFVAYLAGISFGLVIGYSSPALAEMTSTGVLTEAQGAWFASILNIGAFAGCFAAGSMLERYGRKLSLMCLALPFLFGWLLICIGQSSMQLYMGRFLGGMGGGMVVVVAPAYVAEMSSASQRGLLGAGVQLSITIGILLSYMIGMFVSWSTLALLCMLVPAAQLALCLKLVDTPRYLLMKGQKKEALQALAWLRGPVADIDEECRDIEENLPDKNDTLSLNDFTKPQLLAPLKVAVGLNSIQQLTGINAVMFYTVSIFQSAGYENSGLATTFIGLVQVVFTLVACVLMDRAGRRTLLLLAGAGMTLSCVTLGYYYYVRASSIASAESLSWLAMASLVGYIVAFSLGWGPIPMLVMSEILPAQARGTAGAISTGCAWTISFIITYEFAHLQSVFGAYGVFWLFGALCLLGTFFVWRKVPETKGKSLEDIELHFLGRSLRL